MYCTRRVGIWAPTGVDRKTAPAKATIVRIATSAVTLGFMLPSPLPCAVPPGIWRGRVLHHLFEIRQHVGHELADRVLEPTRDSCQSFLEGPATPSPQGTSGALSYPILRRLSSTSQKRKNFFSV